MELRDYVCLLPEQKIEMIQRDLKGAARDYAVWEAAKNVRMGEAFREVNSWWRRSPWRSAEDFELIEAVLNYDDAKNGRLDHLPSPDDVLDMHLDVLRNDIEEAMDLADNKANKPRRYDAGGVIAFWEEHAKQDGLSDQDKQNQVEALALFWEEDSFREMMLHEAFRDYSLGQDGGVVQARAQHVKQAIESLAEWVPYMHGHVAKMVKFYQDFKPFYARLYDKNEAEKTALVEKEKLRMAHATMMQKAEASLRPEGRHHNLNRNLAMRQGTYVAPLWTPPEVVSRTEKTKRDVTAYLHKHGVDKAWDKMRDKMRQLDRTRVQSLPVVVAIKNGAAFARQHALALCVGVASISTLGVMYFSGRATDKDAATPNQKEHVMPQDAPQYNTPRYNLNSIDPFKTGHNDDVDRSYDYDAVRARVLEQYLQDSLEVNDADSLIVPEAGVDASAETEGAAQDDKRTTYHDMPAQENLRDITERPSVPQKISYNPYALRV